MYISVARYPAAGLLLLVQFLACSLFTVVVAPYFPLSLLIHNSLPCERVLVSMSLCVYVYSLLPFHMTEKIYVYTFNIRWQKEEEQKPEKKKKKTTKKY